VDCLSRADFVLKHNEVSNFQNSRWRTDLHRSVTDAYGIKVKTYTAYTVRLCLTVCLTVWPFLYHLLDIGKPYRLNYKFGENLTLDMKTGRVNLKSKGQGHWERKVQVVFRSHHTVTIALGQSRTIYTYILEYIFQAETSYFFTIFVWLSVCLSHTFRSLRIVMS